MPTGDISLQSSSYLGGSSPTEENTLDTSPPPPKHKLKYLLRKGLGDQALCLLCKHLARIVFIDF